MIAYISGKIFKKNTNSIIILNQGIGYEIMVPTSYIDNLVLNSNIELYTYMHVREDLWQLFGFLTEEEKEAFSILITVSGIGPKSAIAILSDVSIDQLATAIHCEDIKFLTKLPGVGKKTAQRLIFELKEKLPKTNTPTEIIWENNSIKNNVCDALVSLGYQQYEINKILPELFKKHNNEDESTMIKLALKSLASL